MPLMPLILALTAAVPTPAPATGTGPISPAQLLADDKVLASTAFEGRAPGTPGEARTIDWLIARLRAIGLEPGGVDGTWTQRVAMVRTQLGAGTISVAVGGRTMPLVQAKDIYLSTVRPVDEVTLAHAPLVFVGHGVSAPERGWDDFKGVDLHGKVAVFLVNDPDFAAEPRRRRGGPKFGGRRMTYYGRWTYKFEEAARRGADRRADRPRHRRRRLWLGDGDGAAWRELRPRRCARPECPCRAGSHHDTAQAIFAAAGLDLDRAARRRPQPRLPPRHAARHHPRRPKLAVSHEDDRESQRPRPVEGNAHHPDEVVMYGAHWDAYGKAQLTGTIRPGANDDGLGVAGLLGIAQAFAAAPRPDRSIVFGIWTGEESAACSAPKPMPTHPAYQPAPESLPTSPSTSSRPAARRAT